MKHLLLSTRERGHVRGTSVVLSLLLLTATACGSDLTCGDGTISKDGVCIAEAPTSDPTLPAVQSVKLLTLNVTEEGRRDIYVNYAFNVSGTLEVQGDAFESDVVVGLSSKDGKKSCIAGAAFVSHSGGAEPKTVSFEDSFYVQSGCDALDGESDVLTWVAFDPFRKVKLEGAADLVIPDEVTDSTLVDLIQSSSLDRGACKAGEGSAHPDSCETALNVKKSPGMDLVLRRMSLGNSVSLLKTTQTNAPDFVATADFRVFGDVFDDETDLLEDNPVETTFFISPKIDFTQMPDAATMAVYAPRELKLLDYKLSKAGEATLDELRQQFLSSLQSAEVKLQGFALRMDKETRELVTGGKWSPFVKFEITACAKAPFEETDADGVNDDNNCRNVDVIIVRDQPLSGSPIGGHGPKTFKLKSSSSGGVTGSIGGYQVHEDTAYGSSKTIQNNLHLHTRAVYVADKKNGEAKYGEAGFGFAVGLRGWFSYDIIDVDVRSRMRPDKTGEITPSITVFEALTIDYDFDYTDKAKKFEKKFPAVGWKREKDIKVSAFGFGITIEFKGVIGCSAKVLGSVDFSEEKLSIGFGPYCEMSLKGKVTKKLAFGYSVGAEVEVIPVEVDLPLTLNTDFDLKKSKPAEVQMTTTLELLFRVKLLQGKFKARYENKKGKGKSITLFSFTAKEFSYTLWKLKLKKYPTFYAK